MLPRRRLLEGVLWCGGVACLLYVGWAYAQIRISEREGEMLSRTLTPEASAHARPAASGGAVAELEIPSIALRAPVFADCSTSNLNRGLCVVEGTAAPGGLGTTGIAGHRDTNFRALGKVEKGAMIEVRSASGSYRYVVDSTAIVSPKAMESLEIQDRPELTLITCYPFHYIGAAPNRFVVHAHLLYLPLTTAR